MPPLYRILQSISLLLLFLGISLTFEFSDTIPESQPQAKPLQDIFATIASHPDLHAFSDLLDISGLNLVLPGNKNYTVFAPISGAFSDFNTIEVNYLKSRRGQMDLLTLLMHHIHTGNAIPADNLWWSTKVPTMDGEMASTMGHWFDDGINVNDGEIQTRDVMASNGIIQTVSTVLRPTTLRFTILKYVIGLGAHRFASLMYDAYLELTHLDFHLSSQPITILAPCDEALADMELPSKGSMALEQWVRKHIIRGSLTPENLYDGQMWKTEAMRQLVKVEVKDNKVKFDQASVLVDPVIFLNAVIYVISKPLGAPSPALIQLNADPSFNSDPSFDPNSSFDFGPSYNNPSFDFNPFFNSYFYPYFDSFAVDVSASSLNLDILQYRLVINEKVLGSVHPDTALSLNDLASLYYNQRKFDEAEPLYQRGLAIYEMVLGSEHPDTVRSLNNLALFYYNRGRYYEAESLYQKLLAICEKIIGPEHHLTATPLNKLASLYSKQGKYDEAELLYQRALAIREKMGSEHPLTAASLDNLASLYKNQGRYDEAEPLYQRALAIRKGVFGSHPDVVRSLNNLASLYKSQGKYDEAELMYQQALAIHKKFGGSVMSPDDLANFYEDHYSYFFE